MEFAEMQFNPLCSCCPLHTVGNHGKRLCRFRGLVLLFSSLSVFALCRLLWPTLRSTHHIDDQDAPTDRSEAEQPQDQTEPWPSGVTGLEVLKPAADDLLQRLPVSKRVNSSGERPTMIQH